MTKENLLIWQKHFLKQSHFVRCPALGLLSNSLCGLRTKKFGDPWSRASHQLNSALPIGSFLWYAKIKALTIVISRDWTARV